MKKTIPLVETGRLDHEHLPANHPDLRGIRRIAADLDCSVEEARELLEDMHFIRPDWAE